MRDQYHFAFRGVKIAQRDLTLFIKMTEEGSIDSDMAAILSSENFGPHIPPPNEQEIQHIANTVRSAASGSGNEQPVEHQPFYGDASEPVPEEVHNAQVEAEQEAAETERPETNLQWATKIDPDLPKLGFVDKIFRQFCPSVYKKEIVPPACFSFRWIPTPAYKGQSPDELMVCRIQSNARGLFNIYFAPATDCIGGGKPDRPAKVFAGWGLFFKPPEDIKDETDTKFVTRKVAIKVMMGKFKPESRLYEGAAPILDSRCPLEFLALTALRTHPNIVYLYDFMADCSRPEGERMAFMEFLDGEPLADLHERWLRILSQCVAEGGVIFTLIPEVIIRGIFIQIAQALQFMHYHGFAHNHLHQVNVMADKHGTYKLIDFSLNIPALHTEPSPEGGVREVEAKATGEVTTLFTDMMSPEVLQQCDPEFDAPPFVPQRSDMWTFGAMLFVERIGFAPFPQNREASEDSQDFITRLIADRLAKQETTLWHKHIKRIVDEKLDRISSEFLELLECCLEPDPASRFTAFDVVHGSEFFDAKLDPLASFVARDTLNFIHFKQMEEAEAKLQAEEAAKQAAQQAALHSETDEGPEAGDDLVKLGGSIHPEADIKSLEEMTIEQRFSFLRKKAAAETEGVEKSEDSIHAIRYERLRLTWPPVITDAKRMGLYNAGHLMALQPASIYTVHITPKKAGTLITCKWVGPDGPEAGKAMKEYEWRAANRYGIGAVQYKSWKVLGQGSFGTVHLGTAMCWEKNPENDFKWEPTKLMQVVVKLITQEFKGERRHVTRSGQEGGVKTQKYSTPVDFLAAASLRHPHLCLLMDYAQIKDTHIWVAVLELLAGGPLSQYHLERFDYHAQLRRDDLARFKEIWTLPPHQKLNTGAPHSYFGSVQEVTLRGMMHQMFIGLQFMHYQGFGHLDIKPDNTMFDKHGNVKLVDFGLSFPMLKKTDQPPGVPIEELDFMRGMGAYGTRVFMAPEIYAQGKTKKAEFKEAFPDLDGDFLYRPWKAFKADMYSMGVMIYVMLTNTLPHNRYNRGGGEENYLLAIRARLKSPEEQNWYTQWVPRFKQGFSFSDECVQLLKQLMQPKPENRPTTEQVLRSDWFAPQHDSIWKFHLTAGEIVQNGE